MTSQGWRAWRGWFPRVLCAAILCLSFAAFVPAAVATRPGQGSSEKSRYERDLRAAGIEPHSANPSGTKPYAVCPAPSKSRATCLSAVVPETLAARRRSRLGGPLLEGSGQRGGYSPADLRSAYNIPSEGGEGLTIATTIAYDYPTAESDLATYRATYGLPPCTSKSGCFRKVNQKGSAVPLPKADSGWAAEAALDLDMASATCPQCKLLLVEADDNTFENLPRAVDTAATLGADVISNSWGGSEFPEQTSIDPHFDHPGIPVLVSSGDSGYGAEYPAASPDVIATGGTSLHKDAGARGWRESAWSGAGSGCSAYEEKPAWQSDAGCSNRTIADVAAVGNPQTPVSVYDTYQYEGWLLFGGTSVSAPLLAGVEALASPADRAKGAERFWEEGPEGKLFDVGEGINGHCLPAAAYLCTAKLGYDGPTGWGTPGGSRPGPPVVGTYEASGVGSHEATLDGAVNPNGEQTTYRFEYDTTPYEGATSHGTSVPVPDANIGSGSEPVELAENLTELTLGVTYHYRLVAVNGSGTTYGGDRTFTPSTWSPQHMPWKDQDEEMFGVSCPSPTDCVSVGAQGVYYNLPTPYYNDEPLVERWDGAEWIREAVPVFHPPADGYASRLEDVSCSSPDACMAVGTNYEIDIGYQPLGEQLDGSEWSLAPMPMPSEAPQNEINGQHEVRMHGISCAAANACVAVGEFTKIWHTAAPEEIATLIEVWDGQQWTVQPSPNPPGSKENLLWGVSCPAVSSCVAVGESRDSTDTVSVREGGGSSQAVSPLIERWNGTEWSIDTGPSLAGGLQDVSCSAEDECMAVGGSKGEAGGAGIAERWDGSAWTGTAPKRPARGVSCPRAGWCVAVGGTRASEHQAYGQLWNGSEWTADDPALPSDASDDAMSMFDVSCASGGCTAVGWYWSWGYQPLAERYSTEIEGGPPSAVNDPVGSVTQTTALLNGHVDNNGADGGSSCQFELALKSQAGTPIDEPPCEPNPVNGDASTPVHATVTGLSPGVEYVYRVVAENEVGTSTGEPDEEFTTAAAAELALKVKCTGSGTGSVSPVDCGKSAEYESGSKVTLTATPGKHSAFKGWTKTAGTCTGTTNPCEVTISGFEDIEVEAEFKKVTTNLRTLTLKKSAGGTGGTGTVSSKPRGINCGTACKEAVAQMYENSVVVLKAKASTGSTIASWTGCEGSPTGVGLTEGICEVTMSAAKEVKVAWSGTSKEIFNAKPLTFSKGATEGKGTVKVYGSLACEAECSSTTVLYQGPVGAKAGKTVTLKEVPAFGSEFSGWSGCKSEPEGNCVVTMESAKSVSAEFALKPTATLTLNKGGTGSGTVSSKPKAINCGATCTTQDAQVPEGETIVLKAKASTGMTLSSWSGCKAETGVGAAEGTCTVSLSGASAVTASFSGTAKVIPEAKKLTLAKAGSGYGTVKAAGLTCEALCTSTVSLYAGPSKPAKVTLKAISAPGSKAVVWSGCESKPEPEPGDVECVVTMNEARNVTATFDELE